MRPSICLYLVGSPPPEIATTHGTFSDFFAGLVGQRASLTIFDGLSGRLPPLEQHAAVVITGSSASLTCPQPWMEATIELVRRTYRNGPPLLGVCFGHQAIGAAFGAGVIENPAGWEIATYELEVLAEDPLFDDMPRRFPVNLSHQDMIDPDAVSPRGWLRPLARSVRTPIQAVAAGDHIRGIQFHPEFDGAITRAYITARREPIAADASARNAAGDQPDQLLERTFDAPLGKKVFDNFLRHWVEHGD